MRERPHRGVGPPPYRVGLCHCLDCRKHRGSLFHASAVFPEEVVTIDGRNARLRQAVFCSRCSSSVFARSADEIEVNLGWLDAPDQLRDLLITRLMDLRQLATLALSSTTPAGLPAATAPVT